MLHCGDRAATSFDEPTATTPMAGVGLGSAIAPIHQTVRAKTQTDLFIQVNPNDACTLSPQNEVDHSQDITLYADDRGLTVFHSYFQSAGVVLKLIMNCHDSLTTGPSRQYCIEIRSVDDLDPVYADTDGLKNVAPAGTALPALADGQVDMDQRALNRLGYPTRPDPDRNPAAYRAWLERVSKPSVRVSDKTVMTSLHHEPIQNHNGGPTNSTSDNWSGYAALEYFPDSIWDWANGEWVVPAVWAATDFAQGYYSSTWVGLGGYTSEALPQVGTAQQTYCSPSTGTCVGTYYAWVEYAPLGEQQITTMLVATGDHVSASLGMVDGNGNRYPFGPNAELGIYNDTRRTGYGTTINIPPNVTYVGESAEWIFERPLINGSISNLPQFADTDMTFTMAQVEDRNNINQAVGDMPYGYSGVTSDNITMTNASGGNMATVSPGPRNAEGQQMTFHWVSSF